MKNNNNHTNRTNIVLGIPTADYIWNDLRASES